jgi:hypothetical protein
VRFGISTDTSASHQADWRFVPMSGTASSHSLSFIALSLRRLVCVPHSGQRRRDAFFQCLVCHRPRHHAIDGSPLASRSVLPCFYAAAMLRYDQQWDCLSSSNGIACHGFGVALGMLCYYWWEAAAVLAHVLRGLQSPF